MGHSLVFRPEIAVNLRCQKLLDLFISNPLPLQRLVSLTQLQKRNLSLLYRQPLLALLLRWSRSSPVFSICNNRLNPLHSSLPKSHPFHFTTSFTINQRKEVKYVPHCSISGYASSSGSEGVKVVSRDRVDAEINPVTGTSRAVSMEPKWLG